ncbi:MAG: hypothetical protein JWM31_377, partial [Solirubrobacterales bacterium]|nr:hypothetical protein [Solirubrobacterales bacterium]
MTLEAPLYQQALTFPARQDRAFIAAAFDTEGVLRPSAGGLLVAQRAAGTNMSVDVAAGSCIVAGDDEANQGSYFCRSTAVENVVIGAAPGSNSRIDLIVARVRDATVTGVSSDWILEVIPGAVAASPVVPSTPNTAIPLAKVTVATGTTAITNAMITDLRTAAGNTSYLGTAGGTMTGELVVPDLKVTGLTGSVTASRYVGANTGAPTTGAHLVGDWIIDPTGKVWICTVAGTPGTWVQVGAPAPALIGRTYHAPGTQVNYAPSAANALQAIDTTNLTVGFTAPASGVVLVRLTGVINDLANSSNMAWGLVLHSTSTLVGVLSFINSSSGVSAVRSAAIL